jgi:hypothetical protein
MKTVEETEESTLDGDMRRGDYLLVTGKLSLPLGVDPATMAGALERNANSVRRAHGTCVG